MINFDNQIVLITGAGRGLGAAYAKLIATRGGTVIVHDAGVNRDGTGGDPEPAKSVAATIVAAGGMAFAATQNLADKAGCEALVEAAIAEHGRIDALIHSAGLVRYNGIAATPDAEWMAQRNVNIDAAFYLCRAVWPHMVAQQYGRIVLTVSGYGLIAYDDSDVTAYGVGKGAQFGLMNGLAGEGGSHNIKANAISPIAATRIFRAPVAEGELTAESVAPGVALLASNQCPFNGKVLQAAGGKFALAELNSIQLADFAADATPEALLQAISEE